MKERKKCMALSCFCWWPRKTGQLRPPTSSLKVAGFSLVHSCKRCLWANGSKTNPRPPCRRGISSPAAPGCFQNCRPIASLLCAAHASHSPSVPSKSQSFPFICPVGGNGGLLFIHAGSEWLSLQTSGDVHKPVQVLRGLESLTHGRVSPRAITHHPHRLSKIPAMCEVDTTFQPWLHNIYGLKLAVYLIKM